MRYCQCLPGVYKRGWEGKQLPPNCENDNSNRKWGDGELKFL